MRNKKWEEEDQGRLVLRGGPCPPRSLHSGGGNAALAGTGGGSSRSFSLVHRHYLLFLKSVYNIYLYSVYIYIFIYIYRVYVHVLHRPLVATPGPALSVIAVPLLVALSCVVSGPDTVLKVDKRVLHLVKEHH